MEKSIFNRLAGLAACGLWFVSAVTGYAQPSVTYLDWDDAKKEMVERTVTDYVPVTSETRTLADGKWYVVADQITINNGDNITVNGAAHLILCDDASLTVTNVNGKAAIDASMSISVTNALAIYAQKKGTGRLVATGGKFGAGIGGGDNGDGGVITINGGTVTATGGNFGAGIGGGDGGLGGTVTINGGTVTATGGEYGAGIGGGHGGLGGTATINGGTVTATGGYNGAGIGGGDEGCGGTVTISGGKVTATGGKYGAGIGGGDGGLGGMVTISGGKVTSTGADGGAGIGGGWKGNGGTVTISGGAVTVTGGTNAAGIGGGERGAGGTVTIDGGRVTATGGMYGAGIGGGDEGRGGTVTISGGEVTATGGTNAAGIGGGNIGDGGVITISGGEVTANGGTNAAGIGGGYNKGVGGTVTISGGRVTAVGNGGGKGIGGGSGAGGGSVKITDGTVFAEGWNGINAVTIDGGSVLSVSSSGKKPIDPEPMNTREMNVYCVSVALSEAAAAKGEKVSIEGLKDYGTEDLYPLDGNKLYLYLPNGDYDFSVYGRRYLAFVRDTGTMATPIDLPSADDLPFDGVLMQDDRPLGNTNATALVRVDGVDFDVSIRTDADGRFASSLPRQAMPTSAVVFASAKVGDRTIPVNQSLAVPQLPYAFGADTADRVVADGEFTVVDSEVTVLGDLDVSEDVTAGNGSIVGSVNGSITVGQPSPAKATVLREIAVADDATRIYGIGDPVEVLDAHLEGKVTKDFVGGYDSATESASEKMLYAYLAPQKPSSGTLGLFQITKAENFVIGTTPCSSPAVSPEKLYNAFPDSDTSKFFAYTAEADGFVTVEIKSKKSYGGIALTVDFKGSKADAPWCLAFEQGWHRSAWNPQQWQVYLTDTRKVSERPAFNREYTFAMRRGELMHLRTLLQACFDRKENAAWRLQCACDIDLHVKVTFRPIGFAE